ncbi:uncharacterized protein LOC143377350 isoform X2 [Andrena cerasifolii]|uniref:uncharacterized protein LOC143377350 isoform X2 n=1 Tax=Andrena cerasifolii TaxID=2819439 RepID=UPI0040382506
MKFNEHQCPSLCSQNCNDRALDNAIKNIKPPYYHHNLSQKFFKCFCESIRTATKRLNMERSVVYEKLKRPLRDADMPALLIFLKKHEEITHVNLASNSLTDGAFINLLDHLRLYKNIQELDLQNNNIVEHGMTYFLKVAEYIEVKSLNLRANKFGVEASQDLALSLLKNQHLLYLNVADVDQTASSLIYFIMVLSSDQEISNRTLKSLDISRPNPGCMYHFDSTHFASVIGHMLKNNSSLAALHLQKYNFSCHDIEIMMSNAKYNGTLHLLDLGCNNIGDHGVEQLASWLSERPALKTLVLCRNIITDHGARALSYALPFSKLLSLDVSFNRITDEGMIVKRMLVSQVLTQENIDVRPYRVDHKWYFARYQGDRYKKEYHDIPYEFFSNVQSAPPKKPPPIRRTYYEYVYTQSSEFKLKHSTMTIALNISRKDCQCCYCLKCEAPHYDELCRDAHHLDTCRCCKCKGDESSDWSADKSITNKVVTPPDRMKNITYILKRANSTTEENILRWINIDEDVLKEDLKAITGKSTTEESSSEDTVSCNCSWVQLSVPTLQKYLEEVSSKDLLIIPRNRSICNAESVCKSSEEEISITQYCSDAL